MNLNDFTSDQWFLIFVYIISLRVILGNDKNNKP